MEILIRDLAVRTDGFRIAGFLDLAGPGEKSKEPLAPIT
jgi:hypothetical protein